MTNPLGFLGRHVGASIAGGVAIAALAGGGIAYAATSSSPSSTTTSPPPASAPPTTVAPTSSGSASGSTSGSTSGKHDKAKAKAHGVRGTITAINGSTWTVKTAKGVSVTVTVTTQTQYGTKQDPATQASFTVGSPATVIGQRSGSTITATRVIVPVHPMGGGSSTSTTTPAAS